MVCWFLDRAFVIRTTQDQQEYCQLHHGDGRAAERVILQHDGSMVLHGDWRRTAQRLTPLLTVAPNTACLFDTYDEVQS